MRQREQETKTTCKTTPTRRAGNASTSQLFIPQESQMSPQSDRSKEGLGTQEGFVIGSKPSGSVPVQASHPLFKLQRQYGNRCIQRAVHLMRKENDKDEVTPEVETSINRKRGGGQALESNVRTQMETALGTDFKGVRVHIDSEADTLNQELNARAFTTGQDIFFREGEYDPSGSSGRELLAHELTHVLQQNNSEFRAMTVVSQPGDHHEQEANRNAQAVVKGSEIDGVNTAGSNSVAVLGLQLKDRTSTTVTPTTHLGLPQVNFPLVLPLIKAPGRRSQILEITRDVPNQDIIYEKMAHRFAYKKEELTPDDRRQLERWGYEAYTEKPEGGKAGFAMFAFRPKRDITRKQESFLQAPVRPVLAFRGTDDPADYLADADVMAVGGFQWAANESKILQILRELQRYGRVDVIGHSLGGALAQITASNHPTLVGRVVTYQSPGISEEHVRRVKGYNRERAAHVLSTHHRVKGDFVPLAGEAFTPGKTVEYNLLPLEIIGQPLKTIVSHTSHPLERLWDLRSQNLLRQIKAGIRDVDVREAKGPGALRPVERLRLLASTSLFGFGMKVLGLQMAEYVRVSDIIREKMRSSQISPQQVNAIVDAVVSNQILPSKMRALMLQNLSQIYPERFTKPIQEAIDRISAEKQRREETRARAIALEIRARQVKEVERILGVRGGQPSERHGVPDAAEVEQANEQARRLTGYTDPDIPLEEVYQ